MSSDLIKLTDYTKGGGCGCKIPPAALSEILDGHRSSNEFGLISGNTGGEDAAVWDLGNDKYLLSTTDFFTPIVDDPFDFGRIAAANSISDIYAMGGTPVLALSILAWPTEKLPSSIASEVLRGARSICQEAGIAIGGGHSIENPEPVFGLSVNGLVEKAHLKRNDQIQEDDVLILTKPLGSGILTTAMKRNLLSQNQKQDLVNELVKLNKIGEKLGKIEAVHAMTDVTGFGIIGHLLEMLGEGKYSAEVNYSQIPLMNGVEEMVAKFVYADNTMRNWKAYNEKVQGINGESLITLCDPQTNGGLLLAVDSDKLSRVEEVLVGEGQFYKMIGRIKLKDNYLIDIL